MDTILPQEDSAIERRRRLYRLIKKEDLSDQVIEELLPNGEPLVYEKQMWDYKSSLPTLPVGIKPSDTTLRRHALELSEVVKDAVAFYNWYGGYLVVGVRDNPREIIGFEKNFDCDELNKKIKAATKHDVDCHFAVKSVRCSAVQKKIGLLLVPQRPDDKQPAQFLKAAPESETGKRAYGGEDIMFRDGHECRPAKFAEEFNALCSQGRRHFLPPQQTVDRTSVLDNNLGPRDPGFIRFIRREQYMTALWKWLCDRYAPGKLLAGVGGVGKTTLAREFAEDAIRGSPMGFERVIWLSAKKRFYTASTDNYVLATRVDFSDTDSLLRSLLYELGHKEEMIDPEWGRPELMDEVIASLKIIPSLVIVDDVDSPTLQKSKTLFFIRCFKLWGKRWAEEACHRE